MNEQKLERTLMELIEDIADDEDLQASIDQPALAGARVKSFGQAGVLTNNRGIILTLGDGSEFQIDIVQSKGSDDEPD